MRIVALLAPLVFCGPLVAADPVVLEHVVSRHDPTLDISQARLGVGLDGNVYLGSARGGKGYVLRVSPDGTTQRGGAVGYSFSAVAANKEGVVATAEAHFAHRVAFWGKDFSSLGQVTDFLVNDTVQWNAPSDIVAGASGAFYAIDQHRTRILKVAAPDKLLAVYALDQLGVASKGGTVGLRVDEERKRFVLAWPGGKIWSLGFDGKRQWNVQANPAGEPPGGFDIDASGRLYVVSGGQELVSVFDAKGQLAGKVVLQPGRKNASHIHDLRVLGEHLVIKRNDATTLFEVYDRSTGKLLKSVAADVDVLTVRYPSDVWTAGKSLPFDVRFQSGVPGAAPKFRVFLRPLGVPEFTELTVTGNGSLTLPTDARGLFQVRVTTDVRGRVSDHVVDGFIEIRTPEAVGSLSIFTPLNRFYYASGENIPVTLIARTTKATALPSAIKVVVKGPAGVVVERAVPFSREASPGATVILRDTTAWQPGRYVIDAEVPGLTVAAQHLEIGAGRSATPPFRIVQHGDYTLGFPRGPRPVGAGHPRLVDLPDTVADHLTRGAKLSQNLFVDRLGNAGSGVTEEVRAESLLDRLKKDPLAVAPEKAVFEGSVRRTIAGYGARGIEEQGILLYMDAGLPIGTLWDNRKPGKMDADLRSATEKLAGYPAFRGWSWAANWWLEKHGAAAAKDASEKAEYEAALKKAKATGAWSTVLETVSDRTFSHAPAAEKRFRKLLDAILPGKLSVMTGPYRAIQTHPPIVFAGADEVDLHYQAEQIQPPQVTPHHVDFYKRPGKAAWAHPELWNDGGTGGMIFPTLLQMVMRGVDGVGQSGPVGPWGNHDPTRSDPRSGAAGTTSAFRTIYDVLARYGPTLRSLENADRVAIVVSTRMQRIETWDGKIGSSYFDGLFEAYNACLYAHRPASFVFVEDLQPGSLERFKAVLVVGQHVELDPPLETALRQAQKKGVKVYHDGTCRPGLVMDFEPLGISFDRVKADPHAWQDDAAYHRFPDYFRTHARALKRVLGDIVKPVAECDHDEVLLSERTARWCRKCRFVWAVNNTMLGWDPGLAWRTTLLMSQRVPVITGLKLEVPAGHDVWDVFAGKKIEHTNGIVTCDLRILPARLYAILPPSQQLPGALKSVEDRFGPHVRDVTVSQDGRTALCGAFDWNHNLYALDMETGETRGRNTVGHAFAYAPLATKTGFAVQGFDVHAAEGYHLYGLDERGSPTKRFALFGLPKRATGWASAGQLQDAGINAMLMSSSGQWAASAGDLGLVVWDASGKELWADEWWKTTRKRVRLAELDENTLVVLDGGTATARKAITGERQWSLTVADTGTLRGAVVSADRKTMVIHADTLGGRLFVLRGGRLTHTIPIAAEEVDVAADGSFLVVTDGRQLKAIDPAGALLWSFTGDDTLRHPRLSPDGQRVVVGSELGTLVILDRKGQVLHERDLLSLPVCSWLPGGDLLAATWMGRVARFGPNMKPRWQTILSPLTVRSKSFVPAPDTTPIVRKQGWGNALAAGSSLGPNLLREAKATITAMHDPATHGDPRTWQNKVERLTDGDPVPPEKPWLEWTDIGYIDSGWRNKLTLEVDSFRTQLRVTGVTFVEDKQHPESWLRDMKLQWWDARGEVWRDGPYLLSNSAVHAHRFDAPIEAAKFRFTTTGGGTWPVGNIRLGELAFHGSVVGPSHPDAVAKKPVAMLFDENEADVKSLRHPNGLFQVRYEGAFSGGKCLEVKSAGHIAPTWHPPFGHALPNWDFEIAEHPEPGQYRYLRFAWKATSEATRGISLMVGRAWPGGGVAASIGDAKWSEGVVAEHRVPGSPPREWTEVTVDLWGLTKGKPPRIQCLSLLTTGGGAQFDRVVLLRDMASGGR